MRIEIHAGSRECARDAQPAGRRFRRCSAIFSRLDCTLAVQPCLLDDVGWRQLRFSGDFLQLGGALNRRRERD